MFFGGGNRSLVCQFVIICHFLELVLLSMQKSWLAVYQLKAYLLLVCSIMFVSGIKCLECDILK